MRKIFLFVLVFIILSCTINNIRINSFGHGVDNIIHISNFADSLDSLIDSLQ